MARSSIFELQNNWRFNTGRCERHRNMQCGEEMAVMDLHWEELQEKRISRYRIIGNWNLILIRLPSFSLQKVSGGIFWKQLKQFRDIRMCSDGKSRREGESETEKRLQSDHFNYNRAELLSARMSQSIHRERRQAGSGEKQRAEHAFTSMWNI